MKYKFRSDIDIDVADREQILEHIEYYADSQLIKNGQVEKHNTGVYFQNVPKNPQTNICNIPSETANELGYIKLDLLNVNIYKEINSEEHLNTLMNTEPVWELLEHEEIVNKLFHINRYYDLVRTFKPTSIEELAIVLALIRPSKKHLIGKTKEEIKQEVWKKPEDGGFYFKKAHGIAYATAIVVQLNLLVEQNNKN